MTSRKHARARTLDGDVWLYTIILLIPCLLCGAPSRIMAQDGPHVAGEVGLGYWMTGAPAPTARTEVAVAALDGLIYVVGGFEQSKTWRIWQSSVSTIVETYDPVTNRWSSKPDLPIGLHHAGAAVLDGDLYVVGGFTVSDDALWNPSDRVFRFNPAGETWTERAPLPTARGGLAVTSLQGKVFRHQRL